MNRPVDHIEETDNEQSMTEEREQQMEVFRDKADAPQGQAPSTEPKVAQEESAQANEPADASQEHEGGDDHEVPEVSESSQPEPAEVSPKPAEEPARERAGEILKREREAQGIPLEVVHEVTKIPMDALRAIEEGYEVRMLSPFYYKGFLKMYAGYLDVDVSKVVDDYREEELPKTIDKNVEEFEPPAWIGQVFTRRRKQQIVVIVAGLLALFLFVKIIGFIGGLFKRRPPSTKAPVEEQTVKKGAVKKTADPAAEARQALPKIAVPKEIPKVKPSVRSAPKPAPKPRPVASSQAPKPIPVPVMAKDVVLTVRAKQNSWLRVRTDGNTVFQSTLRTGAVETWTADREIEISGKNITQLEFELNGKMIGSLGRKDRNAKRIVVTKDGLSVGD